MINLCFMLSHPDFGHMIREVLKQQQVHYSYQPFVDKEDYELLFIEIHSLIDIPDLKKLRSTYKDAYFIIIGPRDLTLTQASLIVEPIGYLNIDTIKKDFLMLCEHLVPLLQAKERYYTITSRYGVSKIRVESITYVESIKHYLEINTTSGKYIERNTIEGFLSEIESERFLPIHRSYVVNLDKIEEVVNNQVVLKDGISLPISRTYKKNILTLLYGNSI